MSTARTGETELHKRLKWAAAAILISRGLPMVGLEVRVPGLRRRADVAGVGEIAITARRYSAKERATKDAYIGAAPTAAILEIKASRADLLRDIGDRGEFLNKLGVLHTQKAELEESIRQTESHLAFQPNLLVEEKQWRYEQSASKPYQRLLKEITRCRNQVYGKTKFDVLARSGVADEFLLVTAPGICCAEEIPEHWGWMSIDCDSAAAAMRMAAAQADSTQLELPEIGWGPGWEISYKHPAVQARWMNRAKPHDAVAIGGAPRSSRRKSAAPVEQGALFADPVAEAAQQAEATSRGAMAFAASAAATPRGRNIRAGSSADPAAGGPAPVAVWIYPGLGAITLHVAPKRFNCSITIRRKWERSLAQSGSALLRQLLSGRLHKDGAQSAALPGAVPFHTEE